MAVAEEERGEAVLGPPSPSLPPLLCLPHTLVPSSRARLASHWLNPRLYIYVIGQGGGIYTQRGSVKSGHKFQNFQTGQTGVETESRTGRVTEGKQLRTNRCTTHSKQELLSLE